MRTGNLSTLSERDRAGIRERLEFELEEAQKELLAQDKREYEKFVLAVEQDQQRVPPAYRIQPMPFDEWRSYADPSISDAVVRGAQTSHAALLSKLRADKAAELEVERTTASKAVNAGSRDPGWRTPASCLALKMTFDQAKAFAKSQAEEFCEQNPDYYPTRKNFETITGYMLAQGIQIPNAETFQSAWERLRSLGFIEERPAPVLEPEPIPVEQPEPSAEELRQQRRQDYVTKIVVTDPRTGEGYTEYQLDRLSADEYRRLMIGEFRTPRITDVIKPGWFR